MRRDDPARFGSTVGVIGTGLMGLPMARRLVAHGFDVSAWNRTRSKAARLSACGASVANSVAELGSQCDVVVLVVSDAAAVNAVLEGDHGLKDSLSPGSVVIDMSSIPPAEAIAHAAALSESGVAHLDAPVSGGTRSAADGSLSIMVGGPKDAYARCLPILNALGKPQWVGPAGTGMLVKVANQIVVGITIAAVSEALLLAEVAGADLESVRSALLTGFADSRILDEHGQRMIKRLWDPGAKSSTQLKDLETALTVAESMGIVLPTTESVTLLYRSACANGLSLKDHSALLLELERLNGIG